jgi:hypothetical protein
MNDDEQVPDPEPTRATVWCPECQEPVVVKDVHAFLLGVHQRVCAELTPLNGEVP